LLKINEKNLVFGGLVWVVSLGGEGLGWLVGVWWGWFKRQKGKQCTFALCIWSVVEVN